MITFCWSILFVAVLVRTVTTRDDRFNVFQLVNLGLLVAIAVVLALRLSQAGSTN